ncbi:methyltransferase [Saccharopolyspora shandongensis]|uniref:methyltransferase n=1 Tax=Saccharopolyspora shandongensis TaxID=418495 RepID=UPI0033F16872
MNEPGSATPYGVLSEGTQAPPAVRMYEMLYSSLVSQLLIAVAELGVADAIHGEPTHVDDIAARVDADADSLYRGLRALASVGVFTEVEHRVFDLTPLAATLRSDGEGSMRALARYVGLPERQRSFGALAYSLRSGRPAFEHVHGRGWWAHFADHPELAKLFNDAMGSMARMVNSAMLEAYDLTGVRHLVDVAGGQGHLVATILARYPEMTAEVFDLPRVVPEAEEVLRTAGLSDRAKCVGGDFFDSVPAGGDVYVLSWTIHDWKDEDAISILRNIRAAMSPESKLLVIDEVLPPGDTPHFGKFEDIVMLSLLSGHVRTEPELTALFEKAGLRHEETRATSSPTSVLVASPA